MIKTMSGAIPRPVAGVIARPAAVTAEDLMNAPDPFLLEAIRKARVRCNDISTASGDVGALAQVMDVLLFAEERSAMERSELLNQTRDIPQEVHLLKKRLDEFETGTIGELRKGLNDALKRIGVMETDRAIKVAVRSAEEQSTARWISILKTALVVTWTAIITSCGLFAFFYRAIPRDVPDAPPALASPANPLHKNP